MGMLAFYSCFFLPSPSLVPFIVKEFSCSSCHEITLTKSATNEGMEHLSIAEFPRITYSLFTSDSYCCCTTVERFHLLEKEYRKIYYEQEQP